MTREKSDWVRTVLVIALLAGTAIFLHSRGQAEMLPPRESLSSFPLQLGNWQGRDIQIPQWALDVLGEGEFVERTFTRAPSEPWVDLFVAFFASQRMGSTMHSPQNCMPGAGWTPVDTARIEVARPNGEKMRINRYVLAKGLDRMLVLYWYQAHGRVVASEYWSKIYLVEDSIRMNRSDGAMVRVMTPIATGESITNAEQRGIEFVRDSFPVLPKYLPQ